jgi:hypothetical protein
MPAVVAILLQGVLFGVAHVDPVRGAGNAGLAIILTGVGIAFGGAAYLLRRIGPTVVAHAIFNGIVMAIVLTGLGDDLRDQRDDLIGAAAAVEHGPETADTLLRAEAGGASPPVASTTSQR